MTPDALLRLKMSVAASYIADHLRAQVRRMPSTQVPQLIDVAERAVANLRLLGYPEMIVTSMSYFGNGIASTIKFRSKNGDQMDVLDIQVAP